MMQRPTLSTPLTMDLSSQNDWSSSLEHLLTPITRRDIYLIPQFPLERIIVTMLLHRCCATHINSSRNSGRGEVMRPFINRSILLQPHHIKLKDEGGSPAFFPMVYESKRAPWWVIADEEKTEKHVCVSRRMANVHTIRKIWSFHWLFIPRLWIFICSEHDKMTTFHELSRVCIDVSHESSLSGLMPGRTFKTRPTLIVVCRNLIWSFRSMKKHMCMNAHLIRIGINVSPRGSLCSFIRKWKVDHVKRNS